MRDGVARQGIAYDRWVEFSVGPRHYAPRLQLRGSEPCFPSGMKHLLDGQGQPRGNVITLVIAHFSPFALQQRSENKRTELPSDDSCSIPAKQAG